MQSTAQINRQEAYLILTDERVISRNSHHDTGEIDTHLALTANGLYQKALPFYYRERVRLTFVVSDKFKRDFSLIRGLIEFHRPRNLVFSFDRKYTSVGIDISAHQLDQLQAFLSKVFEWIVKEKQFRHALKLAIEFENRHRIERDSIYGILRNTTAAARAL